MEKTRESIISSAEHTEIHYPLHEADRLLEVLFMIYGQHADPPSEEATAATLSIIRDRVEKAKNNFDALFDRVNGKGISDVEPTDTTGPPSKTPEIDRIALTHALNQLDRLQMALDDENNPAVMVSTIREDLYHVIQILEDSNLFALRVYQEDKGKEGKR